MSARSHGAAQHIAAELGIDAARVHAAISLLDDGNTVPFIARYRKEQTGGLDDEQLRELSERLAKWRSLEERRAEVLRLLAEQGQLEPTLQAEIEQASTLQRLEDLYRPFRPKRTTRASIAKERGLEPLAESMIEGRGPDPLQAAAKYVSDQVPDVEAALQGARDIVAERLSDDAAVRERVRALTWKSGKLAAVLRETERADHYRAYNEFAEALERIPAHRILALNRGEREEAVRVRVVADDDRCRLAVEQAVERLNGRTRRTPAWVEQLQMAAADAYKRLIAPAIEREVRAALTERAEEQALQVFRANLRALLLQPPLRGRVVMGLDPAFRTGVKVAVVDATGRLLQTGVVYPTVPQRQTEAAARQLTSWVTKYRVDAVAIGNGTASRETEQFVAEWLATLPDGQRPGYCIIDEAGASVYSASAVAKSEFPNLDVSERSAVSIARRLQDPLAELVKIEPRALGVGQYQHDVDAKRLDEQLTGVVEATVNQVGVDLNTASAPLLSYVAGLSHTLAANIVARREEAGPFASRKELLEVKRLGPRTFEQCAGFLRLPESSNPLDRTPIHPESYSIAEELLAALGFGLTQIGEGALNDRLSQLSKQDVRQLAAQLGCGEPTLADMIAALQRPGRDPREDLPPRVLRSDVLDLDDLYEGLTLQGTVRNVVDFGAFVDIGVKQDGLVHVSELADRFVKHPLDVVSVGDTVQVRVLEVDRQRGRISLSMKV